MMALSCTTWIGKGIAIGVYGLRRENLGLMCHWATGIITTYPPIIILIAVVVFVGHDWLSAEKIYFHSESFPLC